MLGHEFNFRMPAPIAGLSCLHCGKLFVHCVNRDGTYNTKCVKRKT